MEERSQLIGLKAYRLELLQKSSLPVPPFVTLPVTLYQTFIKCIEKDLHEIQSNPDISITEKSFQAQKLIWTKSFPAEFVQEIFKTLHTLFPASRLLRDSWALCPSRIEKGDDDIWSKREALQGAFLGVKGEEKILEAIKSLWSIPLEENFFIEKCWDQMGMAIIISPYIDAEISGTVWTSNPFTRRPHEMVIRARYGIKANKEDLFDDFSQYDEWITDQQGEVLREHIAEGKTKGLRERVELTSTLNPLALKELVHLGKKVEQVFHHEAQEFNWCYDQGQFWILSIKPIEHFRYFDKSRTMQIWSKESLPLGVQGIILPLSFSLFERFWNGMGLAPISYRKGEIYLQQNSKKRLGKKRLFLIDWGRRHLHLQRGEKLVQLMHQFVHNPISDLDELDILYQVKRFFQTGQSWFRLQEHNHWLETVLSRLLKKYLCSDQLIKRIIAGVEKGSRYDFLHLALWICGDEELFYFIRESDIDFVLNQLTNKESHGEWDIFRERFIHYLEQWGGGPFEFKFEHPSFVENPRPLLQELREILRPSALDIQEEIIQIERRREWILGELEKDRKGPVKWFLTTLVSYFWWGQHQEQTGYKNVIIFLSALRGVFHKMAQMWVKKGVIKTEQDIFYLTLSEIENQLKGVFLQENLQSLIELRKEEIVRFQSLDRPEAVYSYGLYDAFSFFGKESVPKVLD